MSNPEKFSVNKRDWSLHRTGHEDEARHNEKVKEAIRGNLPEIISDGSIITADPQAKRIVKIPMKSLELPRFRFGKNDTGFGSGPGGPGDIIGQGPGGDGEGQGEGAGDQPGIEYYEAELTLDELRKLVYEDLGLPYLEPKQTEDLTEEEIKFNRLLHKPRTSNIDLFRTVKENMKRTAAETGQVGLSDFESEDLWVRTWDIEREHSTNAVIIAMADISGSMGDFERYVERAFCWWMCDALRHIYPQVEIIFIVHDTEAEEVSEEAFFTRGSSGGTMCSSANKLALDLINSRYPTSSYNLYLVHFSDGDNYSNDNAACLAVVKELLELGVNQYGYVQIGARWTGDLLKIYLQELASQARFHAKAIRDKTEIYPALKAIFDAEKA